MPPRPVCRHAPDLLPLLVLLLLASCASLEPFAKPEVAVANVRFDNLTLFETSGTLTVRITNENPEPIVIEGGVHQLSLDGISVGKALSNSRLEIDRLSSVTEDLPLQVDNLALATRLIPLFQKRSLGYRIKSKIYVRRPYGLKGMSVVREGRFDLPAEDGSLAPPPPGAGGGRSR